MLSISFWSWPGWGAFEALGTVGAALIALRVYLSEVARRRRAERKAVRVWIADNGGKMEIYIVNDSQVPIVDTKIMALYQQSHWESAWGGMRWAAIGWVARGPRIVHPAQTEVLVLADFKWNALGTNLPAPMVVRLEYEASAESQSVQFARLKEPPAWKQIVDCGHLAPQRQQVVADSSRNIPSPRSTPAQ
ncbi:hypothetical protein AB0J84_31735 [Micromonospora arborensis]|uniref:hypothetical protein n=1 Tax=Micromonospora arborensis TaxID=2116518 RepID=UPI003440A245